jgi:hypothetical protein
MSNELTRKECEDIAEILDRRANEIAGFHGEYKSNSQRYRSVELAMTREINRLRKLSNRVCPPAPSGDDA